MTAGHVFTRSDSRTCRAITIYNNNDNDDERNDCHGRRDEFAAVSTSF